MAVPFENRNFHKELFADSYLHIEIKKAEK